MSQCFIFGSLDADKLCERPQSGDLVIAADRGYEVCARMGIIPDVIVGDFDSLGYVPQGGEVIRLNVRKDDTDLEHAVRLALDRGCTDFVVYGAVGGQLDHTLGNIAVAEMIANRGGRAIFYGDKSAFTVIRNGAFSLPVMDRGRISVFSLNEIAHGVTIRGLSYEVEGVDLPRASTRGVGNLFIGQEAHFAVGDGVLLIVWER